MSKLTEKTRALHEDLERLEQAAVAFLLEEPRSHKESVNQSHKVAQVIDQIQKKTETVIDIYKDVDNSRRRDSDAISGEGQALFSIFYDGLRDIKDYHRRFPNISVSDPRGIASQITGSENISFSAEESNGKYVDLNRFYTMYTNLPWMKGNNRPIDYFVYLRRAYSFGFTLEGKGKEYHTYVKELLDYTKDHIRRSQPLYELDAALARIEKEFNELYEKKEFKGDVVCITEESEENVAIPNTYCLDCLRSFAKSTVFNGHLKGKKHKSNVKRNEPFEKELFFIQFQLQQLGEVLADQIDDTKIHLETKLARRYEDIAADMEEEEHLEEVSDSDTDEEEEMTRRCITNYPVGWDGKPIPYWLYKLHGLGIEYKCEICGNTSYFGRRSYERHFQEWRHAYGMKCLGIPNTKHFNEITNINDALALWEKVRTDKVSREWNPDEGEEYEDADGNVMIKKTYLDLKRQGLEEINSSPSSSTFFYWVRLGELANMASLLNLFNPPTPEHLDPSPDGSIGTDHSSEFEANNEAHSSFDAEGSESEDFVADNSVHSDDDDDDDASVESDNDSDIEEISETIPEIEDLRPKYGGQHSLLNLFAPENDSESESDIVNIPLENDPRYTFVNTVYGSFKDELAEQMQHEVQERMLLQSRKMEEQTRQYDQGRRKWSLFRFERIKHHFRQRQNIMLYLCIMGTLTGITGFTIDLMVQFLEYLHFELTYTTNIYPVQYLLWVLFTCGVAGFAVLMVSKVSKLAIGSGIPEMKSILSGVTLSEYFSFRTLLAKVFGLSLVLGAGMVVGKEGPFVHTACIIAHLLYSFPFFHKIRNNGSLRQQVLTCAIACGVAGNFGAPIGGLLFSIEVTSTYYPVRNYYFSAWAAMFSGYTFRLLWNTRFGNPLFAAIAPTSFTKASEDAIGFAEIGGAVFLGIAGGLVGICFIFVHLLVVRWRRIGARKLWLFRSPFPYSVLIICSTGLLLFPGLIGDYMALPPIAALKDLYVSGSLANGEADDWLAISPYVSVTLFVLSRFWLTVFSISLPVPCGLFVPVLTVGGGIGRIVGEAIAASPLPLSDILRANFPGIMAVVGAAGVGAGVTQTFSVAVIMFELTGQIVLLVPVTVAVIIAIAVSRIFTYNVYDGILQSRKLPYLPDVSTRKYTLRAVDIMDSGIVSDKLYGTREMEYRKFAKIIKETPFLSDLPIVEGEDNMMLVGITSKKSALDQLAQHRENVVDSLPIPSPSQSIQSNLSKNLRTITKSFTLHPDKSTHQEEKHHGLFDGVMSIGYENAPVQLDPSTPLTAIHILFITLRLETAFVTLNGKLMGVISRSQLKLLLTQEGLLEWFSK